MNVAGPGQPVNRRLQHISIARELNQYIAKTSEHKENNSTNSLFRQRRIECLLARNNSLLANCRSLINRLKFPVPEIGNTFSNSLKSRSYQGQTGVVNRPNLQQFPVNSLFPGSSRQRQVRSRLRPPPFRADDCNILAPSDRASVGIFGCFVARCCQVSLGPSSWNVLSRQFSTPHAHDHVLSDACMCPCRAPARAMW